MYKRQPHEFGYPQHRKRIYIVAIREDLRMPEYKFPEPNNAVCDLSLIPIYLFLLCADGHAGITAVTAAAGPGGLLLLFVFPEKERVIFQCLHILCAAQEDISEIRLNGRPVQFAVQLSLIHIWYLLAIHLIRKSKNNLQPAYTIHL